MRLEIFHNTTFTYSKPAFLEPHVVRLCPHTNAGQRVDTFAMNVEPAPTGQSDCVDLTGTTTTLWFDGMVETVTIGVHSVVEMIRDNPFAFIITEPTVQAVPVEYSARHRAALAVYLQRPEASAAVDAFASEVAERSGGDTLAFLSALSDTIYHDFHCDVREHGDAWPASKTLELHHGACRDLAVLFMDACRAQGLAARFVSGYVGVPDEPHRYLHAWPEVYLPGAGWRGYDPSNGLAVANDHVSVAFAAVPEDAAPISGTFRGTGVTASIEYDITINVVT